MYGRASAVGVFTMKITVKRGHSPNLSFSLVKVRVFVEIKVDQSNQER